MKTAGAKPTKAEKILHELRRAQQGRRYRVQIRGQVHTVKAGWVPSTVLLELAGWRYSARLYDLKKQGFEHESEQLEEGVWIYRLKPEAT